MIFEVMRFLVYGFCGRGVGMRIFCICFVKKGWRRFCVVFCVLCFVFLCGYEYYFVNMIHMSGGYWLLVWANSCKDVC